MVVRPRLMFGALLGVLALLVVGCAENPYEDEPRRALADAVAENLEAERVATTMSLDGDLDLAAADDVQPNEAEQWERALLEGELYFAGTTGDPDADPADTEPMEELREGENEFQVRFSGESAFAFRIVDASVFAQVDLPLIIDSFGLGMVTPADITQNLEMFLDADVAGALEEGSWIELEGVFDLFDEFAQDFEEFQDEMPEEEFEQLLEELEDFYRETATVEHLDSDGDDHEIYVGASIGDLAALVDDLDEQFEDFEEMEGEQPPENGSVADEVPPEIRDEEVYVNVRVSDDRVVGIHAPIGEQILDISQQLDEPEEQDLEEMQAMGLDTLDLIVDIDSEPDPITAPDDAVAVDLQGLFEDFPFGPGPGFEDEFDDFDDQAFEDEDFEEDFEDELEGAPEEDFEDDFEDELEDEGAPEEDFDDFEDEDFAQEMAVQDAQYMLELVEMDANAQDSTVDDPQLWNDLVDEVAASADDVDVELFEDGGSVEQVQVDIQDASSCLTIEADDPQASDVVEGACD